MLSSLDLNNTRGQQNDARLRSSTGGPPGAFLTTIPGNSMLLGNDMFVLSEWHFLGHHVQLTRSPRRANAVQVLLPNQIMRWSARR